MTPQQRADALRSALEGGRDDSWRSALCHALGAAQWRADELGDDTVLRVLEDAVRETRVELPGSPGRVLALRPLPVMRREASWRAGG